MKRLKEYVIVLLSILFIFGCNISNNGSSSSSAGNIASLLLNEFKANIPEDEHAFQYIELRGEAGKTIKKVYLVVIDGDEGDEGNVDYVRDLNGVTIGSNGLIIIKNADQYNDVVDSETTVINDPLIRTYDPDVDGEEYKDGILEHDAVTYALIASETAISRGDDLDTDDDGTLDLPAGAEVIDSVGNLEGGVGFAYTSAVLSQSASDPDAATRFADDLNENSIDAWANGDIYEDPEKEDEELPGEVNYFTMEASANLPPRAKLTPGNHNFKKAPFVLLNEIVNTGDKYIELLSNPFQSLDDIYLITVDSSGDISISVDLSAYSAEEAGITLIKDTGVIIESRSMLAVATADLSSMTSASTTVLLVYSPDTAISSSLDFDTLPENASILDNFGWGDTVYLDVTVDATYDIEAATRYKDNRICAISSWTYGELLDSTVDYSAEFSKNVPEDAKITMGAINVAKETAILVTPFLETDRSTIAGADADDMAFWIHPDVTADSLIIATQKSAGYSIYDVNGETLLDALPGDNRYNNVDVMYGFRLDDQTVDIAVFSDRNNNKFGIYTIQDTPPYIVEVTDPNSDELFEAEIAGEDTAHGEGVYKSPVSGKFYAFATQKGTWNVAQFELVAVGDKIGWTKVRSFTLEEGDDDEYAEGIVVDQEYGKVYIAQEEVGIYMFDAEPGLAADVTLDFNNMLIEEGDHDMMEDLEGMTIYYGDNGGGYVFVSSQGNNIYGVFDRTTDVFIGSFAVVDDMTGIDGTQGTDSLDVTNVAISDLFPKGAFIVQDGTDTDPDDIGTNFKWIKWDDIASQLDLTSDSTYDVRNPVNRIIL